MTYHLTVHTILIRDWEKGGGGGVWRGGGREIIYLSLHCHLQNDSCIKMGSDQSSFNVSLILRDNNLQAEDLYSETSKISK